MTRTASKYRVWDAGRARRGTAKEILDAIRKAAKNPEIVRMSVKEYADALIEDAPYFLDVVSDELQSLVNYTKSVVDFDRSTGMTLKKNNIEIDKTLNLGATAK